MGVWSGSGSVAVMLTMRKEPLVTVWFSMVVMVGGLSFLGAAVSSSHAVSIKSPARRERMIGITE